MTILTKITLCLVIFCFCATPAAAQIVVPANSSFSADDANGAYNTLIGPSLQESVSGELELNGTIVLTTPEGYEWDTGGSNPSVIVIPNNTLNFTRLTLAYVSRTSTQITYRVTGESGTFFGIPLPGTAIFGNLRIRPTTGSLPNSGDITNTGTTAPSGATSYGTMTMLPGLPSLLSFSLQPSNSTVGQNITPSVQVQLLDQFSNAVSIPGIPLTVSLASGNGILNGTLTKLTNDSGIASFDDLQIDQTGSKTIQVSGAGLTLATSNSFEILPAGVLTNFLVEDVGGGPITQQTAGEPFDIRISAVDGSNTVIPGFTGTVIISSNGSLTQGGGTSANFVNGVLASHSVTISNTGSFTIKATGSVIGESNTFTVDPNIADPTTSIISANPTTIQNDGTSTSTITVTLKDAFGNSLISGGESVFLFTSAGSLSPVTDNGDGTYSATLTSSTTETTASITGTLNAQSLVENAEILFATINIWQSSSDVFGIFENTWARAQNWSLNAIPGPGEAVMIPTNPVNGNGFPVLDGTDNPTLKSLTLALNASITLTNQDTLTVLNSIAGSGTINADNGTFIKVGKDISLSSLTVPAASILLNGNSHQEISGDLEIYSLFIQNNQAGVSGLSNITINNVLDIPTNQNLNMESGTELIVKGDITGNGSLTSNASVIRFGGDVTTLSQIDASTSDVIFEGTAPQVLNPTMTTIQNLEINNPSGVTADNNLIVLQALTLTDGILTMGSGNSLIPNTVNGNGSNLQFLRDISGNPGWRLLSAPANSNFNDFLDALVTQGYPGAFYDASVSPNDTLQPSVLWYDETNEGTDNQRFRAPASSSDAVVPGRGYFVYVFGDVPGDSRYNQALPITLSISGAQIGGAPGVVDLNVTYTAQADTGWNLVGNPFGATIDWDHPSWTKTNMGNTIYVWDPDANGGAGEYLYWNGTTGTLADGLIPPFQAFWVKANGSNPVLQVDKSAKTTGGTFLRKGGKNTDTPILEFLLESGDIKAGSHITFSENGQKGWDDNDGYWLTPLSDTYLELFTTFENGSRISLNNLPRKFGVPIEIPIYAGGFKNGESFSGEAHLSWSKTAQIPNGWNLVLEDKLNGRKINLRDTPFYSFQLSGSHGKRAANYQHSGAPVVKGKTVAEDEEARFVLTISPGSDAAGIPSSFQLAQNYPNPFNPTTTIRFGLPEQSKVSIEVYDILGRLVQRLANEEVFAAGFHTVTWSPARMASGVYLYRVRTNNQAIIKKMTYIK